MADDSSILQEIDEALRADKVEQFWKQNRSAIITFCVMIVLASTASVLWKNYQHDVHERQTTLLFKATRLTSAGKYDDAIGLFEKAEESGGKIAALAGLRHAEALIALKQDDKAFAVYNDLAAGKIGDAPEPLRDYARLSADILTQNRAAAAGKSAPATDIKPTGAFSRSTSELAALRALAKGDSKTAADAFTRLVNDENSPISMRERDMELLTPLKENAK